ncbi:RNA polymerase sigma-70 factor (ECF subfamily) [Dyadobacter jejuensis]|uniref:RNA polymerase sigma-70 factor (ECF subfamily) n=1 Tax=Dyadobacter jejuensis TaxID=1082580 RepID=A0A316BA18_9BACT|nr:RNA polymerase sigma-70 factor [Dyadobacter jejuensis]PWJ59387.1 RNA polymerase sigma-70 factor (ECF subfamily) [Dyadobacter jejuensis]
MNGLYAKEERPSKRPFVTEQAHKEDAAHEMDTNFFIQTTFDSCPSKGLELLFRRFYGPLCSHAVRFVYSRQIAEDLVSEVFFQFYRTRSYENITTSYTSYLFRSVRNECYSYMKRECKYKVDSLAVSGDINLSSNQPEPDAEIHFNNLSIKINEVIDQLPKQCQKVFLMSRFENKKYHEIAKELDISPKTVEVHVSKALKFLRASLSGEWLILALFFINSGI